MRSKEQQQYGLFYDPAFLSFSERQALTTEMQNLGSIWEWRFSPDKPPPPGEVHRKLLRPVYWLGNWQFACLHYYRPPKGTRNRCVEAEPFPPVLAGLVKRIQKLTHRIFRPGDVPRGWELNTCLVNYYGDKVEHGTSIDCARVGEHRDFEPGPVASISLGERALFQFVQSTSRGTRVGVAREQWLSDGSLQIFGGRRWKDELFHRVQRVENKLGTRFETNHQDFHTRRINLTLRYVPREHWVKFHEMPEAARNDVTLYVKELARTSAFWKDAIGKLDHREKTLPAMVNPLKHVKEAQAEQRRHP